MTYYQFQGGKNLKSVAYFVSKTSDSWLYALKHIEGINIIICTLAWISLALALKELLEEKVFSHLVVTRYRLQFNLMSLDKDYSLSGKLKCKTIPFVSE